jgi:hypothetical protein
MSLVDEQFTKLKTNLEITKSEQALASKRQNEIRDHLEVHLELDRTFLTGSYARHTKTKRLKDVDIFCVVRADGGGAGMRGQSPWETLTHLQRLLVEKYTSPTPSIGRRSCTVELSSTDEVPSFDVVLAFDRKDGGFEIPDRTVGDWIASDPEIHKTLATEMNGRCDGRWIPFVKMIKGFNREWEKPVRPSFLLEVMALELIHTPFGRYQDEIVLFLANAAERIQEVWPDPAGLGPDVNSSMNVIEKQEAARRLREACTIAERAVQLEDDGSDRAAIDAWRELFGSRMPKA